MNLHTNLDLTPIFGKREVSEGKRAKKIPKNVRILAHFWKKGSFRGETG